MITSKNYIFVLILTLITVLGWVGLEVYRSFNTSTIPLTTQDLMLPLSPNFDQDLIQKIKSRTNNN